MDATGRYARSLGRLPWFAGLTRRDLCTLARLVDDLVLPGQVAIGRSDRQILLVVDGAVEAATGAVRGPGAVVIDTDVRTCGPTRLLVVRRSAQGAVAKLAPVFAQPVTSVPPWSEASSRPGPSAPARLSA